MARNCNPRCGIVSRVTQDEAVLVTIFTHPQPFLGLAERPFLRMLQRSSVNGKPSLMLTVTGMGDIPLVIALESRYLVLIGAIGRIDH